MGLLLVVCSLSALLLLLPASATPALTQLQEELLPLQGPEELLGADMLKAVYGAPEEGPWEEDPSNSALADKENALSRLLKDLMRTSKRSWSRYKKGNLRSCFGVRLERIGSFSGLGC
ncbi:natriuretic peptide A-like isoform X2 [Eucyclogobius newberryi]|uniref:natriuretic peptide A-like isoform X2 n=1 Tax=Eucyclogobius newberryi TaxID=166745 RepID=UPI003B5B220C